MTERVKIGRIELMTHTDGTTVTPDGVPRTVYKMLKRFNYSDNFFDGRRREITVASAALWTIKFKVSVIVDTISSRDGVQPDFMYELVDVLHMYSKIQNALLDVSLRLEGNSSPEKTKTYDFFSRSNSEFWYTWTKDSTSLYFDTHTPEIRVMATAINYLLRFEIPSTVKRHLLDVMKDIEKLDGMLVDVITKYRHYLEFTTPATVIEPKQHKPGRPRYNLVRPDITVDGTVHDLSDVLERIIRRSEELEHQMSEVLVNSRQYRALENCRFDLMDVADGPFVVFKWHDVPCCAALG